MSLFNETVSRPSSICLFGEAAPSVIGRRFYGVNYDERSGNGCIYASVQQFRKHGPSLWCDIRVRTGPLAEQQLGFDR